MASLQSSRNNMKPWMLVLALAAGVAFGGITIGGGGSITTSTTGALVGVGSPQGVVAAYPGQPYVDSVTKVMWIKISGNGTTDGWE